MQGKRGKGVSVSETMLLNEFTSFPRNQLSAGPLGESPLPAALGTGPSIPPWDD